MCWRQNHLPEAAGGLCTNLPLKNAGWAAHVAHIDQQEVIVLFASCPRPTPVWLAGLGFVFEDKFFIFGPRYSAVQRSVCLVNVLLGQDERLVH